MDLAQLLALLSRITELSDEELEQLRVDLVSYADGILEAGAPNEGDEDALLQLADGVDAVRAAQTAREQQAAEREARLAGIAERFRAEDPAAEGEQVAGDGEETPAEGGDGTEGGEAPSEGENAPPETAEAQAETVTAAAPPARVTRVAARRPRAVQPVPSATSPVAALTAAANVTGFNAGERLDDPEKLARALGDAITASVGYKGPSAKVTIAHAQGSYPTERHLGRDAQLNSERIGVVQREINGAPDAITAAGGLCAPTTVLYDVPGIGVDDRPVRAALAAFAATRGGVRTLPPPTISDLSGAVGVWTETTDANPGQSTKGCLVLTCPDEDETIVDAIYRCLEIGNFRQRFWPEQVAAWVRAAGTWQARFAESRLLTTIGSGSTHVTAGQGLGTARDVLTNIDRAGAAMRNRHRMAPTNPLRFMAPAWLKDQIRADLARELPGATAERLATADAQIDSFLAARSVNVTWFLDGETGQIFGPQGVGPITGWPSTVITYLFPEGSWLFLDGGTLDLGIVRDSTLNSTNDFQLFAETFEAAHFFGFESLKITMDVCPSGTTSGTTDFDPCGFGS